MSEPATSIRPFYVTGGTLKPGEPSYVERLADTELFESLLAGEFCYVLTARQMGKSSLMARTAKRLEQAGVASAIVDLTQIGSERGDQAAAQWYFGVANQIHRQLGIAAPLRLWWQERSDLSSVQRLTDFFRELVLAHCPGRVVVFVDEIDSTIGLPFADDFFAALRACFNARAIDAAFERLTFALLGVATPGQLIQDPTRTPFNIGKRIDLTDFSLDEARKLASELHADPGEADRRLERVLHWTGGHPYLTQALCRAVRDRDRDSEPGTAKKAVDPRVEELFLSSRAQREETNLKHARARLERSGPEGRRLLQLYRRVRQGQPVPDQPTSPLFAQLKLAGVVKTTDKGRLTVRNRIYEAVFTSDWAKSAIPADRGRQLAAATLAAALAGVLVWYAAFQPRPYEQALQAAIEDDGYTGALEAYTNLLANPFSRSRATELMQQFWEQRALRYALVGDRDQSLLSCLQGLRLRDSERLRRKARNLVGIDYERLRLTLWHGDTVTALAFSPDGRTLATASEDNTARLWDARSGTQIAALQHQAPVLAVAFSSDGRAFATWSGGKDKAPRFWDARSGKPMRLEGASVKDFSPTDRIRFVFGSKGNTNQLGDTYSKKPIALPVLDGPAMLNLSPDGRILATWSWGNTVRVWDSHSGKPIAPSFQHPDRVSTVVFSLDGRTLAIASEDTVRLWDARPEELSTPLLQYQAPVYSVAFSPDGRTLAIGFGLKDNTAQLWDARSGKPLTPPLQHQGPVLAVAFSPDGGTVLTGSRDNTARLWNARSGKLLIPVLQHQGFVYDVAFSPDGGTALTGSLDNTARLWDARSGKLLTPPLRHGGPVLAVAFSPDGGTVLTGASDNTARLWDARSGKPLTLPLQHQVSVDAVAFSPDGRTALTASEDSFAKGDTARLWLWLWDARTGKSLARSLPLQGLARTIAFKPDGKSFFVATDRWLNTYSWDGKKAVPQSSQLLHGIWKRGFRFPADCERCLQVVLGDTYDSFRLETLHLDEPTDPPIEGDPKEFLEKWQARLGLTFDEQMKPVPR
ncbi:MAG TPA: AAA-like domain-containing protein [Thermoanaerobaculia bacterium]